MMTGLPDKRRDQRIYVVLPVFLENATGVTSNLSDSDVFFWSSGTHSVGEQISFSIAVPKAEGNVMMKCRGDIVRMEPRGTHVGVAVRITESVIEPA